MPSPLYDKVVKLVASYIGEEKAAGTVGRQLAHCSSTPDSFAASHMNAILGRLTAATSLYMADTTKKSELAERLKAIVG